MATAHPIRAPGPEVSATGYGPCGFPGCTEVFVGARDPESCMAHSSPPRDYRTLISAASLVAGPLIMSIGDLLHPEERMAPAEQMAILVEDASRWYTAMS